MVPENVENSSQKSEIVPEIVEHSSRNSQK
jgi:hypothetical protein